MNQLPASPRSPGASNCEAKARGTNSIGGRFMYKLAMGLSNIVGHRSKKISARRHLGDYLVRE